MKLIDKDALSMELMNEVLNAYAKADFRFAHEKQQRRLHLLLINICWHGQQ